MGMLSHLNFSDTLHFGKQLKNQLLIVKKRKDLFKRKKHSNICLS